MRRHIWWLVGLVCTLLVIAMSATPGHRARLATAEASPPIQETLQMAQRPGRRAATALGTREVWSRDRWDHPSQLSQC